MTVKLLTEHHLEFLRFKEGCKGSSKSTLLKLPHCWKSHVTAQLCINVSLLTSVLISLPCSAMGFVVICNWGIF